MEQNVAILIADLSGYTALTETHGPATAADTIDKFIAIANDSLVGDTKLHQHVGDEVLIVSSSPDHLMSTGVALIKNCVRQHNFLQLHGGLHYGKLLNRKQHYFGSPINLTSRIAAKANTGTLWCSSIFINQLSIPSPVSFSSKGKYNFKNVSDEIDVFEVVIENEKPVYIDPVCRMQVDNKKYAIASANGMDIFFCSNDCREIYIKNKVV